MKRRNLIKLLGVAPLVGITNQLSNIVKAQNVNRISLNKDFDSNPQYFISEHNIVALAVTERFLSEENSSKLLIVQGTVGNGKTCLINHVIKNYQQSNKIVLSMGSEIFLNKCVNALRQSKMYEFREQFYNSDLLIVDEIEYIGRGEYVQDELYFYIRHRIENNKKTILTTSVDLNVIKGLHLNFLSIIDSGLRVNIKDPTELERYHFAKFSAAKVNLQLLDEHYKNLAGKYKTLRAIEGAVVRKKLIHDIIDNSPAADLEKYLNANIKA